MKPSSEAPERVELSLAEIKAIQLELLETIVAICAEHGLKYYLIGGTMLGAIRHKGFIPWDDDIDIALPRPDYNRLQEICRESPLAHYQFFNYRDDWRLHHNISKLIDTRTELIEEAAPNRRVVQGVYVDIFPLDGVPRGRVVRAVHYHIIAILKGLMEVSRLDPSRPRSWRKRALLAVVHTFFTDRMQRAAHRWLENLMQRYDYDTSAEVCNYAGAWGKREFMSRAWFGEGVPVSFEGLELNGPSEYDRYLRQLYGNYMQLPPVEKQVTHHRYRAYRTAWPEPTPAGRS